MPRAPFRGRTQPTARELERLVEKLQDENSRMDYLLHRAGIELRDIHRVADRTEERLANEVKGQDENTLKLLDKIKRREATIEVLTRDISSLKSQLEGLEDLLRTRAEHTSGTGTQVTAPATPSASTRCKPAPSATKRQGPTKAQKRKARADRVKERQTEQHEEPADLRASLKARRA